MVHVLKGILDVGDTIKYETDVRQGVKELIEAADLDGHD